MAWHAKPSGGYGVNTTEGTDNINEVWAILQSHGYTQEAAAGVLGNVKAESGLNPWRWQGDTFGTSRGYGLFQFTPASDYINLPGATPNMSTSAQTTGATAADGARQVDCFANDELSKWVPSAWRPYWSTTTYADLYAKRATWLSLYGSGNSITMAQFAAVTDIEAATFFMLACFEGAAKPNLNIRVSNANEIYNIMSGGGGGGGGGGLHPNFKWLMIAMRNNYVPIKNIRGFHG